MMNIPTHIGSVRTIPTQIAFAGGQTDDVLWKLIEDSSEDADTKARLRQTVKDAVELKKTPKALSSELDPRVILKDARKEKERLEKIRLDIDEQKLDEAHQKLLRDLREFLKKPDIGVLSAREFLKVYYAYANKQKGIQYRLSLGQGDYVRFRWDKFTALFDKTQQSAVKTFCDQLKGLTGYTKSYKSNLLGFGDACGHYSKIKTNKTLLSYIKKVLAETMVAQDSPQESGLLG